MVELFVSFYFFLFILASLPSLSGRLILASSEQ